MLYFIPFFIIFCIMGFVLEKIENNLHVIFLLKIIKNKNMHKKEKREAFRKLKLKLKEMNKMPSVMDILYNAIFILIILIKINLLILGIYFCHKLGST